MSEPEDQIKLAEKELETFSDAVSASKYDVPISGEPEFGDGQNIVFRNGVQTELDISRGNIVIGENNVSGYDKDGAKITSPNSNGYTIVGSTKQYTVRITGGVHNITLNNLDIQVNNCPFWINGAAVNLTLADNSRNTLASGNASYAGLQVATGSSLILDGSGELIARGNTNGAGIGGGPNSSGGSITIRGNVSVTASGGTNSAGIGGGTNGSGGTITIEGNASVTASGGTNSAGIGGGSNGESGNIVIQGNAFIEATGGQSGAAIGSGSNKGVQSITFNGNVLVLTHSNSSFGNFIGMGGIAGSPGIINKTQGVIFEGDKGTVYGSVAVSRPFTVPAGGTLSVQENATLTVPQGMILTNNGIIENKGQITGDGSITNDGTINDYNNQVSVNLNGTGIVNKPVNVKIFIYDSKGNPITDANYGETITVHAEVYSHTNIAAPDGTVTFKAGTNLLENVTVSNGHAVSGEITLTGNSWKPGDYTIQANYSGGAGLFPSSIVKHNLTVKKASRTITLTGTAAINGSNVNLPVAVLSEGSNDGTIQYGYSNTNDITGVTNWQNSRTFNNLQTGKKYYFFAKVSEGVYHQKAESSSMEVEILSLEAVWVNGVNLIQDPDREITCGSGKAAYSEEIINGVTFSVLTLTDAKIDTCKRDADEAPFIWISTKKDCIIRLVGENIIGNQDESFGKGIKSDNNLIITGPGHLTIDGGKKSNLYMFEGISANDKDITIDNTSVTIKNSDIDIPNSVKKGEGISIDLSTPGMVGKIILSKAKLEIVNCGNPLINRHGGIEITESEVSIKVEKGGVSEDGAFYGILGQGISVKDSTLTYAIPKFKYSMLIYSDKDIILDNTKVQPLDKTNNYVGTAFTRSDEDTIIRNGCDINVRGDNVFNNDYSCTLYSKKNIHIDNSTIEAVAEKDSVIYALGELSVSGTSDIKAEGYYCGLQSDGDMTISGGKINAVSSNDNGIYTRGSLEISGASDIKTAGYYCGIQSLGNVLISGGKIESVSSDDIGICTRGNLSITGGEIYAKGSAGHAGIGALNFQTSSEEAVLRIHAEDMAEKNNAQAASSDWFHHASSGANRSWSSFIPLQEKALEVENGAMLNASTEVWLKPACTVTFDINGGSGANTTVKVYPGNTIEPPAAVPTRPGYYLSGWLAQDGSYFDFASTPIDQDMTLRAKWSANVYDYYYSIQASAGEHGTITPSGNISVPEYTDQTFTFTPGEGYETAEVLVDGKRVETAQGEGSYKFERVTSGHTISVSFLKIVPESYPNGTVAKPDGSFETPDGVIILPDGTVILNDKDKTELKPDSEGNAAVVNKNGTVTVQDGSVRNPDGAYTRPARPVIDRAQVKGNRVNIHLKDATDGAAGYDYVISPNPNCIIDKDYTQVNKNILLTNTSMFYVRQGTYYAYCHSWLRDSNGKKVFSQWSEGYEFTVPGYTPPTPSVVKIANPKKGVVVVTVSVPEGAKGFDIILGRSVRKVNGEKRPVDYGADVRKNQKRTLKTVTFENVKPGKVYAALHSYSRTPETNAKVFSKWSAYKTIKVK